MVTAYEFVKAPQLYESEFQSPFVQDKLSYDLVIDFLNNVHVVYDNETIYFMDESEEYHIVRKSDLFTLIKAYVKTYATSTFNITNQVFNNILLNMQELSADALKRDLERFIETPQGEVYKITEPDDFQIVHVRNGVINVQSAYENRHNGEYGRSTAYILPKPCHKNHMLFLMKPYNVTYEPLPSISLDSSPYAEPYSIMFPDKDTRDVFFMCMGMILFAPYTWKMLPVLYGPPHTGKSVIGLVLNTILGDEYMAATPLNSLTGQFGLANADKYKLNVVPEGGDKDATMSSSQCGIIKSLTGGDTVSIERKHKDSYTTRPTMKLMISTNHLPQFPPDEEGILARLFMFPLMTPLPFTQQMKINPNYVSDMTRSPEAINWFFNRALVGYFQLCEYTHNNLEALRTPYMMECMEEYRRGDEFTAWVEDRFVDMSVSDIQRELTNKTNTNVWRDFEDYVDDNFSRRSKLEKIGFIRKLCNRFDMGTWSSRDPITGDVVKILLTKTEIKNRRERNKA